MLRRRKRVLYNSSRLEDRSLLKHEHNGGSLFFFPLKKKARHLTRKLTRSEEEKRIQFNAL